MTFEFNIDTFRQRFPAFKNADVWTDEFIKGVVEEAICYINPCNRPGLSGSCLTQAVMLMVAHMLSISQGMQGGSCGDTQGGVVTSATVGGVSVTLLAPPADNNWQYWLAQSAYGQRLAALLSVKSRGGSYVGGSFERRGFRKAGGVF